VKIDSEFIQFDCLASLYAPVRICSWITPWPAASTCAAHITAASVHYLIVICTGFSGMASVVT
jgi:hypothetical protein